MLALLRAGCMPDVRVVSVSSRRSALHLSALCGHEAVARRLILAGADVNWEDAAGKCAPLHVAAAGEHKGLVGDLPIGRASPHARDADGRTPLHQASVRGHDEVVSVLLNNASTNVDALDMEGRTPLELAAWCGHVSTVKTILDASSDVSRHVISWGVSHCKALCAASGQGNIDVLRAILERGADVNAVSGVPPFEKDTALHFAAGAGQAGSVNLLLDAGAALGV